MGPQLNNVELHHLIRTLRNIVFLRGNYIIIRVEFTTESRWTPYLSNSAFLDTFGGEHSVPDVS